MTLWPDECLLHEVLTNSLKHLLVEDVASLQMLVVEIGYELIGIPESGTEHILGCVLALLFYQSLLKRSGTLLWLHLWSHLLNQLLLHIAEPVRHLPLLAQDQLQVRLHKLHQHNRLFGRFLHNVIHQ